MREIALDTETTGLSPTEGHRIVEIGCIELVNHVPTGNRFHRYVNPERDIPEEVVRVHGLTRDFLSDHPVFADLADAFLEFIGQSRLVIHNAEFDLAFLNAELGRLDLPLLESERCVDTLMLARRKFPGAPASLDALCKRFGIDNSEREKHSALLDTELLAQVYLELVGGREPGLVLTVSEAEADTQTRNAERPLRAPRPHVPSEEELAAHAAFLARLKDPIWES
ncbi:MAG: DNA polymerase III subunit epsilon [Alphaproteobacteria bacterium]